MFGFGSMMGYGGIMGGGGFSFIITEKKGTSLYLYSYFVNYRR